MCFVSIKYSLFSALMCHCSNLYHVCNNNYNYSFNILLCLHPFYKPHFFVIFLPKLLAFMLTTFLKALHLFVRTSQRRTSKRNFTQGWLNYCCLVAYFILPLYMQPTSVCRTFSKWKIRILPFSRTLTFSMNLLASICVLYKHCLLLYLLSFCSERDKNFTLMFFILVAFVYCS